MMLLILLVIPSSVFVFGAHIRGQCPEPEISHDAEPCKALNLVSNLEDSDFRVLYHVPADNNSLNLYNNPCKDLGYLTIQLTCIDEKYDYVVMEIDFRCHLERDLLGEEGCFTSKVTQILKYYKQFKYDIFYFNKYCQNFWYDINIKHYFNGVLLLWGCKQITTDLYDIGAWIIARNDTYNDVRRMESFDLKWFAKRINIKMKYFIENVFERRFENQPLCWNRCMNNFPSYVRRVPDIKSSSKLLFYVSVGGAAAIAILVSIFYILRVCIKNFKLTALLGSLGFQK